MAEEVHCARCRAANPQSAEFCAKCGASLDAAQGTRAQPDPLIGATVDERFLVKHKLGEGGMGVVYEAEQTSIGRKVALKVLHPHLNDESRYARFRNEAAAASRLGHHNTITVFDFGRTESGSLYIAMELIEGPSLDDEIRRNGAVEWRRATGIAAQICRSLEDAHSHGIVHRDLKPENVMLLAGGGEQDIVKVLDFGIAKIAEVDGTDQRQALTKTGMVFGTPRYMSPEQVRGEKVDARSDIYSTGIIIYQMLTGAQPFFSETLMGLLTKHLMDPPLTFAQANPAIKVPAELESLVMQMLAKERGERPQSMREVAERLQALPVSSRSTVPMPPLTKKKATGKRIVGIALGALLLLGAGGAAAWYFLAGPGRRAPPPPVTQVAMPPVVPPYVAPPSAVTPPATGPSSGQPPSVDTAPLPAIPSDTGGEAGGAVDTGGDVPKLKGKAKPCSFSGGEDAVQNAVRDALRAKEVQIRACARALEGEATAKFSFDVAANATRVSGVSAKSKTGLETCLEPNLAVAIGESDAKARTGELTISMEGRLGFELCSVQVATKVKGAKPKPETPLIDDKTKEEIVSEVKDRWGQLKEKLGELKSGGKDSDSGE